MLSPHRFSVILPDPISGFRQLSDPAAQYSITRPRRDHFRGSKNGAKKNSFHPPGVKGLSDVFRKDALTEVFSRVNDGTPQDDNFVRDTTAENIRNADKNVNYKAEVMSIINDVANQDDNLVQNTTEENTKNSDLKVMAQDEFLPAQSINTENIKNVLDTIEDFDYVIGPTHQDDIATNANDQGIRFPSGLRVESGPMQCCSCAISPTQCPTTKTAENTEVDDFEDSAVWKINDREAFLKVVEESRRVQGKGICPPQVAFLLNYVAALGHFF